MLSDVRSELYNEFQNHKILKRIEKMVDEAHEQGFIGAFLFDLIENDSDYKAIGILAVNCKIEIQAGHITDYNWQEEY